MSQPLWHSIPYLCILLPLGSAAVTSVLKPRWARYWTMFVLLVVTSLSGVISAIFASGAESYTYMMGHFPAPWGNEIRAGQLEAVTALFFSLIMLLSLLGGLKKIDEHIDQNKVSLYYVVLLLLTAALLLWGRKALLAFGASENTIDYAADYLHIYAFGTLFVELTLGMNAFITAQGFAKVGMYTVLIGAAANIVLDPIFIFALGMGVRGAALATVLSQGLSCAWVLVFLCGKKAFLRLRRENLFVSPKLILPCVALGLATFTMQASESVISAVSYTHLTLPTKLEV